MLTILDFNPQNKTDIHADIIKHINEKGTTLYESRISAKKCGRKKGKLYQQIKIHPEMLN